ncbi:31-O-demethyl-FK506 methyltransferase FkbM [Rubripirellula tenax]|uniref:31-O-demethyl-FK506 methyltransferase FkbM n=1 Tax=Rubripirellula tenax TaxID=2528015 RepID=A0A5C6FEQ4_9BACT|nr:FkbM family methyltransferase [Rubripirellula tenax]TWU59981.1 31-O-demethyl-FK506 methyltransferase FkbM [Rubripirellula tenax]
MQRMKFRGYQLFHLHREAAESMVRQIDEFPSFFTPRGERPFIVDCGANIGVSALEWKTRWPTADVLCFEPDPYAFKVLEKNCEFNDIPGLKCINAAVDDQDGPVVFYGDIKTAGDARGNSIDPAWAKREGTTETTVPGVRLSKYLTDRDVSFLKLDIEGAEQRVLEEIADCLPRIEAIYVEVHETDDSLQRNSVAAITRLLSDAGFTIEQEIRLDEHALPAHLRRWQAEVGAVQTQLMCWR